MGMTGDIGVVDPAGELAAVGSDCAELDTAADVLEAALPRLGRLAAADAVLVVQRGAEGVRAQHRHGLPGLDPAALDLGPERHRHAGDGVTGCAVPAAWAEAGVAAVVCQRLPGLLGHLVTVWCAGHGTPHPSYDVALALVVRTVEALDVHERLEDLQLRVDNAQQLAGMGDYDWHVASDTNRWSDQLYRIYGHEPQSFNASYDRFLSFIHPDDREMVTEVHRRAYETGEPYQMVERIVRADGELRHLVSNGQVVQDEHGTPVRFRGTCIDITERVRAEEDRERSRALFEELVEASPDAIVVCDATATVHRANGRAVELLGGDPAGRPLRELLPDGEDGDPRRAATGLAVAARGLDGRTLQLDVRSAPLEDHEGDDGLRALFLRESRERLEGEALAAHLREAQVRRRSALEINDNVVQGLSAGLYALESGDPSRATELHRQTLEAARRLMSDLLEPLDGTDLRPGDLVRSRASTVGGPALADGPGAQRDPSSRPAPDAAPEAGADAATERARVLVVDDSEDVRLLLTLQLATVPGVEVVGQAADGQEAVERAVQLRPDLVLLDLAMPRMDGLQALPLLREQVADARVIVLSGFEDAVLAEKALAAGASRYVEKGLALRELVSVIEETLAPA